MRSKETYAAAAIELYSRMWLALERLTTRLPAAEDSEPRGSAVEPEMRLVTLRLELIVLLDACDSASWRLLLAQDERRELRATLESVLGMLAGPSEGGWHLMQAQNRLIDAVLRQHAVSRAATATPGIRIPHPDARSPSSHFVGSSPRSSTSTSAEPTMTPSTWPARSDTCSRLLIPKPAHTGTVAAARTRSR